MYKLKVVCFSFVVRENPYQCVCYDTRELGHRIRTILGENIARYCSMAARMREKQRLFRGTVIHTSVHSLIKLVLAP